MNNHWRSLARHAKQKLLQTAPTDMPSIIQLWYIRLLALYQLGFYQLASAEFEKFGDLLTNMSLSEEDDALIPFDMRVLWALLPSKLQHPLVTLERLSILVIHCQRWRQEQREMRVSLLLVSQWIHMQDFAKATVTLQALKEKYKGPNLDLVSSLGRLYLQLGDIYHATEMFHQVEEAAHSTSDSQPLQEAVSLLAMAKGEWKMAEDNLKQILANNNDNLLASSNLAVCRLYLGQLTEAVQLLESTVQQAPAKAGACETSILNLCTLYELRYQTEVTTQKKVELTKTITPHVGDSFNTLCLKL
ncbi:hypothetical protein DM01DRAFT_1285275 [Hesseltinella vesiculosa]|uniref:Uncharacterized protein n=1 Tax=Hesseltinella vesiculosa TaxID=101127 RepID=A0A1X2GKQ2_9FUNG|nr:hypothetical protein DM01DRAFT_1285275 [Hesseltinella vesiculosa]